MNQVRKEIERAAIAPAEIGENKAEQSYCFPETFIGFAGHFPGYPILPAVLQVLMAQMLVEQLTHRKMHFLSLKRAKFMQQLRPGDRVTVKVLCRDNHEHMHCSCELHLDETRAASFTLALSEGAQP